MLVEMSMIGERYEVERAERKGKVEYLFTSTGVTKIFKVVQFEIIREFKECNVYNLGFGDYNQDTLEANDEINSNNADVYKVFHTVLSTIPLFLSHHSEAFLFVRASDSQPTFVESCHKEI